MEQLSNEPYEDNIYCVNCGLPIDQNEPYFIYVEKDIKGRNVYFCDECT